MAAFLTAILAVVLVLLPAGDAVSVLSTVNSAAGACSYDASGSDAPAHTATVIAGWSAELCRSYAARQLHSVAPRTEAAVAAEGGGGSVFWSGIKGGDSGAASWAAKNGGTTLEMSLEQRGISLPAFDRANSASVAAWRQASAEFARGASGDVMVLQGDAVRTTSVWAEVEFPALKANPNVTSISWQNPETGNGGLLWTR